MKTRGFWRWFCFLISLAFGLVVFLVDGQGAVQDSAPRLPRVFRPAPGEFAAVSNSVITLLKTRDTARFAVEMTAPAEDWKAIASTNVLDVSENLKGFAENAEYQRAILEAGAKTFLAKADSLHLDFSKGYLNLHARVESKRVGSSHYRKKSKLVMVAREWENLPGFNCA